MNRLDRNDYDVVVCSKNPTRFLKMAFNCSGTQAFVANNERDVIYICPDGLKRLLSNPDAFSGTLLNELSHVAFWARDATDDYSYFDMAVVPVDMWAEYSDYYDIVASQNPSRIVQNAVVFILQQNGITP